jgi:DNA-binding winged helix-turn-helix (wHTH) protein
VQQDFALGRWRVSPDRLVLDSEGETVRVKPKTMDVLVCLAERAGEVLSRDDLLARVWNHAYVSDDVITQAIAELRRALQDDFKHPVYLETVPRRGYRLIAPVQALDREQPESAAAAAPDVAPPPAPIATSRARPVIVTAATAVLVASVGWATVSVIRGTAGEESASGSPERRWSDLRPTDDTAAYELYLKARDTFRLYADPSRMAEALSLARRAAARDPAFAEAYALIAEIETFKAFWDPEAHQDSLREARRAATAAARIKPHVAYPHAVLGLVTAMLDWKWNEGYQQARHAVALEPDDGRSLSLLALLSLTQGKTTDAVQLADRAWQLNPIDPHALATFSWVLFEARQFDRAAELMAKTLEADPDAVFARNFRPVALAYAGRYDDALAIERSQPIEPDTRAQETVAMILALAGRERELQSLLATVPAGSCAEARAQAGDEAPLLDRLDRLYEERRTNYLMWLRTDPAWDPVRRHPRFRRVLEQVGLAG